MEATPNLRHALEARKSLLGPHTLRALAGRAGISPSYLSRVLAGKRRPLMVTAEKLAVARGMSLDDLYRLLMGARGRTYTTRRVVKSKKRGAR
jgi:transcriptional regulator with XRE-family HTH domain